MQASQQQQITHHFLYTSRSVPRRFKSADECTLLDAIGEYDILVPSKPRRRKSADDLDVWMWGDDNDHDDTISSTGTSDENDSSSFDDGDFSNDEGDNSSFADEREYSAIMEGFLLFDIDDDSDNDARPHRPSNIDRNANSFASFGSNMTAAQQAYPGRFVTPVNSFLGNIDNVNNNMPPMCAPPAHQERILIEPHLFIPSDLSLMCPPLTRCASRGDDLQTTTRKHDAFVTPTTSFTSYGSFSIEEQLWCGLPQEPSVKAVHDRTRTSISLAFPFENDESHLMMPPPLPRMIGLSRKSSICRLRANDGDEDKN